MDSLQLKTPHHIGNFLRKIKTLSSKAMAVNDVNCLLAEVSGLKPCTGVQPIGPCCEAAGITVPWLKNSTENLKTCVTNEMAIEIVKYKDRVSMTWQELTNIWPRLFPDHNWTPEKGRVRQRFVELSKKRENKRIKRKGTTFKLVTATFCLCGETRHGIQ